MKLRNASDFDLTNELTTGEMPLRFQTALNRVGRVLSETPSLVLMPTISPLLVGQVVIFAKGDHTSFADLLSGDSRISDELSILISQYEEVFGPATLFEHGTADVDAVNCGVSRAHVHLIPRHSIGVETILSQLTDCLGTDFYESSNFASSRSCGRSYLSFGNVGEKLRVWCGEEIPSQLVRQMLAAQLGSRCWDWKRLFGWEIIVATLTAWENKCDELSAGRRYSHNCPLESAVLHAA